MLPIFVLLILYIHSVLKVFTGLHLFQQKTFPYFSINKILKELSLLFLGKRRAILVCKLAQKVLTIRKISIRYLIIQQETTFLLNKIMKDL